ncbi:MAG: hypothetical protein Q9160_000131 [Pyrenula sp. 1 TL-2023]
MPGLHAKVRTSRALSQQSSGTGRKQEAETHLPGPKRSLKHNLAQLISVLQASLRPLPSSTEVVRPKKDGGREGLPIGLTRLGLREFITLFLAVRAYYGQTINDRTYLMEKVIELAASLPTNSKNGLRLTNGLLEQLWADLEHPPLSYLPWDQAQLQASRRNIVHPNIGAAGAPYAKSVKPALMRPVARPDPGLLFDTLMERKTFRPHPAGISSVMFYIATIIIHDCFRTSHDDPAVSETSSYLDLAPLYGSTQVEQNAMRTFKNGRIHEDCFSEKRVLGMPPGVCVLLVMFNRFHNFVVKNLALVDENQRFSKLRKLEENTYDEALFQTAKLITCGLYVNIIIKDYVRTLLGLHRTNSSWELDPRSTYERKTAKSASGNQVSAEFNLIYRWHSCLSERDEKFTQEAVSEMFSGADPEKLTTRVLVEKLSEWEASIPQDPQHRSFARLARLESGRFADDDLARLWIESVEDRAGAFGAEHVPRVLKIVEMLGIEQSRQWALCTLNEFRSYFGLSTHQTFEDINPDPCIAAQLKNLYGQPDFVELYPGIAIEATKDTPCPGNGLFAPFTMTRAILSDAIGLVRGDRFCTLDYNPANLTNWGFAEADSDPDVSQGCVLYKLVLHALPNNFEPNSIYAHYPLLVPQENRKILNKLGVEHDYSFKQPASIHQPLFVSSYTTCEQILQNQDRYRVIWGSHIWFLAEQVDSHGLLAYNNNFMLAGDKPENAASRMTLHRLMYRAGWQQQLKCFYEQTTMYLLKEHSYQIKGTWHIDIVQDVINLAQARFVAALLSLPIKTEDSPRGVYTDAELYGLMALNFTYIFYDVDPVKSLGLRSMARKLLQQLGELYEIKVNLIARIGPLMEWLDRPSKHSVLPKMPEYGTRLVRELLKAGYSTKDVVWSQALPFAIGSNANQAQLLSQCLDFYLSEEGDVHWQDISRLAREDTANADEMLFRYFLEGSRLSNTTALVREVASTSQFQELEKQSKVILLKPGDRVICNLVAASRDPHRFPEPEKVRLDRPLDAYIHYGSGPHKCLGMDWNGVTLTTMLKCIARLENLRRAPGPQGQTKKVIQDGGLTAYMLPDESSYSPFPTSLKVQWDGEVSDKETA